MCKVRCANITSEAVFSDSRKYRYVLTRIWDKQAKKATVIMQNPSYADELKNDLSLIKVMNFLIDQGFGALDVINLFAYISTDPKGLVKNPDRIGEKNDFYITKTISEADVIIVAWGSDNNEYQLRKKEVKNLVSKYKNKLKCFKDDKGRMGRHPSRLGNELELIPFKL